MNLEQLRQRLTDSLKRQPRLNGRDEFIRSAVLVLLWDHADGIRLILQKRHPDIRQGDEICFPGGHVDPDRDANAVETALRETEEEMGISRKYIRILGQLDYVIAPTGNLVDATVGLVTLPAGVELRPNPMEVTRVLTPELVWFREHGPEIYHIQLQASPEIQTRSGEKRTLFPAAELGLPERYHGTWPGARIPILVYRYDGEVIWGMTARMIRDLVSRVYGSAEADV